jgi:hypothetical protein
VGPLLFCAVSTVLDCTLPVSISTVFFHGEGAVSCMMKQLFFFIVMKPLFLHDESAVFVMRQLFLHDEPAVLT